MPGKNKVIYWPVVTRGQHQLYNGKPGQQVRAGQPVFIKGIVTGLGESDPMLGLAADVYMDRCYLQNTLTNPGNKLTK